MGWPFDSAEDGADYSANHSLAGIRHELEERGARTLRLWLGNAISWLGFALMGTWMREPTWRRHMSYLLPMAIIAVVGLVVLLAAMYMHHELRPVQRKLPVHVRGRRVSPGDECFCGGIIGTTGLTSARFGDLLRCTDCKRSWTMDGRALIRRSRQRVHRSMPGTTLDSSGPDAVTPR